MEILKWNLAENGASGLLISLNDGIQSSKVIPLFPPIQ